MIPRAIPSAPPPHVPDADASRRAGPDDDHFDAAMQQARPDGKRRDTRHTADATDPASDAGKHDGTRTRDKDDKHRDDAGNPVAAPTAGAPAPEVMRQMHAVNGKPLPADAAATGKHGTPALAAITAGAAVSGHAAATAEAKTHLGHRNGPPSPPAVAGAQPTSAGETTAQTTSTPPPGLQPMAQGLAKAAGDEREHEHADAATRLDASGAPFLHLMANQSASAQSTTVPTQLVMQSTPGQPQFVAETTQHVAWLVGNRIQQAQIQLNPRALGPIHIDITAHHDRVDVSFTVQHPATVQALQQTLPQLADLLAQQGLNLGQASVGQQSPGQPYAPPAADPGSHWHSADVEVPAPTASIRALHRGAVDDFA